MAQLLLGGGGQYELDDRRVALIEETKSFLGPSI
jgi:hypothetical protein